MEKYTDHNVFVGPNALLDYLNPDNHPPTSLVEVPNSILDEKNFRIFAKMAREEPMCTLKAASVNGMYEEAERSGALKGVHTIVMASSGGAAAPAAIQARLRGKKFTAYIPKDAPEDKKYLVRLAGGDVKESQETPGQPTSVELAREMGKQPGHLTFDQYGDAANHRAQARAIAGQVLQQLQSIGRGLGIIALPLGTTGSAVGARNLLQKESPKTLIVGVMCAEGNPVPGVRPRSRLGPKQILFDWEKGIHQVEVERYPAYAETVALFRMGLRSGISGGLAFYGLCKFARSLHEKDRDVWESLRDKNGEINAVFVVGDLIDPYLPKLSTILEAEHL